MKTTIFIAFLLYSFFCSGQDENKHSVIYESETLVISKLSDNVFVHITYLDIPEYGKVACNGMIYQNDSEAMVFDTPVDDSVSMELINWIRDDLKCEVNGVVINHFHLDCLGGLNAFHEMGIPSYSSHLTIKLAEANEKAVPQNGFAKELKLDVGGKIVVNEYFGEGHTADNIACFLPDENTIYGGCLIKSMGAGKGNLEDANTKEWPETIRKIKEKYPDIQTVIPGHGESGGLELLDYTIELFEEE